MGGAFIDAQRICDHYPQEPWRAAIECESSVVDLTQFGQSQSTAPMPSFIYGLRCTPANEQGEERDAIFIEPRPWCRFMADALGTTGSKSSSGPKTKYGADEALGILNEAYELATSIRSNDAQYAAKVDPWTGIEDLPDEAGPVLDALTQRVQDALYSFWALPEAEQRRLLGGWKICPKRPRPEIVAKSNFTDRVARVMEVKFWRGEVLSKHIFTNSDDYEAVIVHIPEGTSKQAAIDSLSRIVKQLESDFEKMVDAAPDPKNYDGYWGKA